MTFTSDPYKSASLHGEVFNNEYKRMEDKIYKMLLREHLPESLQSQAYRLLCDGESNTNRYLLWEPT